MATAVVVGSGPNGLAAAVRLAQHGVDVEVLEAADHIGGGTRSSELTVPGVVHDHCSAFHPMGVGSPYLSTLDLERHGLRWRWPEIDCAHPLDTGEAGLLWRSIDETAAGLGPDGRRWRQMFAGLAAGFDDLADDLMRPIVHVPRHPLRLLRFGPPALLPAALTARVWRTDKARALFGGVAAHAFHPLHRPTTSAIGMTIIAAGHRHGWPVAEGGSQSIANALASLLDDLGGKIHTGVCVRTAGDIPPADVVLLDLAPGPIAQILGDRLPARVARAYRRYRHGPGAFKLDLAIEGDVPWTNQACGRAGTVHLGGTFEEVAGTERDIARGRMPERPFVLVGQQYLADPTRSAGDINPIWTYAHVPARLHRRRHRGHPRPDRALRPRLPRPHRRLRRPPHDAAPRLQPQLRRRRHHHRRQHRATGRDAAPSRPRPVPHRHTRHLHLLRRQPARRRRPRHVRIQRRRLRAPPPADHSRHLAGLDP